MSLRILILDTVYGAFQRDYYAAHPGITRRPYADQNAHFSSLRFSCGQAYVDGLRRVGCAAQTVYINVEPMQQAWAREYGLRRPDCDSAWDPEIVVEQVRVLQPDVVYVQELSAADDAFIARLKPLTRLIVGQVACSIPRRRTFEHHDLIVSSWKPMVEHFHGLGKEAVLLRLGFDTGLLSAVAEGPPRAEATFVGGLSPAHRERTALLESLCERVPLRVYGYGADSVGVSDALRACHRGPAWGLDAARAMSNGSVNVNMHGDIAVAGRTVRNLANNQRMFEATGVGTLLLTDWKDDLGEVFEPDSEVVAYRCRQECAEKVRYYLDHEEERRAIASAGQMRTLRDHTCERRMAELFEMLQSRLPVMV